MKNKNITKKLKINTYFIIWTLISSLSSLVVFGIIYFILNINIDMSDKIQSSPMTAIIILIITQLIISWLMTIIIGNPVIRGMNDIEKVIDEVSNGNYKARVKETKILKEIKHNFNKMISELDSVEILRSDFVNNFSHELKTPIVSIKGYAEELKKDDLTEEEKEKYLDVIIEESNRLSSLSTNILNLSKIEKQEIVSNKNKINIGEQIRKVILMEYKKIEKNNLEIDVDIDDCYSIVNEDLMEQVWINLIENAIKFNKKNGKIFVKVKKVNDKITISIKDTGVGIDEDKINRIYDKFYTTSEKNGKSGNGLGLALTKKILNLHNGSIEANSKLNKGTEFIILLNSV